MTRCTDCQLTQGRDCKCRDEATPDEWAMLLVCVVIAVWALVGLVAWSLQL